MCVCLFIFRENAELEEMFDRCVSTSMCSTDDADAETIGTIQKIRTVHSGLKQANSILYDIWCNTSKFVDMILPSSNHNNYKIKVVGDVS